MADGNDFEKQGVEAEFVGELAKQFAKLLANDEGILERLSEELVVCAQNRELSPEDLIKVFESQNLEEADHD